ncbi:MAG TPA: hypothetical protein ENI27_06750 [bacterium]|nr:hypothetical protein [bacterium]
MDDQKYTKEPWEYDSTLKYYKVPVVRHNGVIIAKIEGSSTMNDKERDANGALIASAPALAERVKELEAQIKQSRTDDALTYAELHTTIDRLKAELKNMSEYFNMERRLTDKLKTKIYTLEAEIDRPKELETQIKQLRTDDALTWAEQQAKIDVLKERATKDFEQHTKDGESINALQRQVLKEIHRVTDLKAENVRLRVVIEHTLNTINGLGGIPSLDRNKLQRQLRAALKPANQEDKE